MKRQRLNRAAAGFVVLAVLVIALVLSNSLRRTSRITLPDTSTPPSHETGDAAGGDALTVIAIDPETVQTAIATLARPDSYRRTVTVEQIWSGGSGTYQTDVVVSGSWTRTDRTLADGRVRHAVTDGADTYIWYNSESQVFTAPAGTVTADDEQSIPTYEAVLDLPVEVIAAADYRTAAGLNCIFVETAEDPRGYALRYWVNVDTGLLAAAEKLQNGEPVYRMLALSVDQTTAPTEADFTLPDGSVLYVPEG